MYVLRISGGRQYSLSFRKQLILLKSSDVSLSDFFTHTALLSWNRIAKQRHNWQCDEYECARACVCVCVFVEGEPCGTYICIAEQIFKPKTSRSYRALNAYVHVIHPSLPFSLSLLLSFRFFFHFHFHIAFLSPSPVWLVLVSVYSKYKATFCTQVFYFHPIFPHHLLGLRVRVRVSFHQFVATRQYFTVMY